MGRVKVKLNSSGMASLLKDAGVAADLHRRATSVLSSAQSSAPRDSGEYASSLFVIDAVTDRAVSRVATRAPHGMIVELRTGNLARSLDAAGGA